MTPRRARNIRKRKFAFQEGRCYLCGGPMSMDVHPNDPTFATFDHVIPLHDGGRRGACGNIKLAHRSCNMKRGRETGMRRKAEVTNSILRARGTTPAETCATCKSFMPLKPGHAAICLAKWRGLPWNAAVPLTSANEWCEQWTAKGGEARGRAGRAAYRRTEPVMRTGEPLGTPKEQTPDSGNTGSRE